MTTTKNAKAGLLAASMVLAAMAMPVAAQTVAMPVSDTSMTTRIVGGSEVADGNNPFTVALMTADGYQMCGASLVAPTLLVTAAHCIGSDIMRWKAIAGRTTLSDTTRGTTHSFKSVLVHPAYDQDTGAWDVAFIELKQPVVGIDPIAITSAHAADTLAGIPVTTAGWGDTLTDQIADRMREVVVEVKTAKECAAAHKNFDAASMICASRPGKDSCQGDSGGPLFIPGDRSAPAELIGVVSWGIGCAKPGNPGYYATLGSAAVWDTLGDSDMAKRVKFLLNR